ncbi:MAG: bifunctional demethylmenaquinone methyltransferase/2-methoxy-6-polyprenyl-1,4-benzoquinol methylase UbiE [Candidatus Gastranaerophilaceae bacterium]
MSRKISKTPQSIKDMFDRISGDYDKLNNLMSFGLHKKIKRDVIKKIQPLTSRFSQPACLDLCCGTGDLADILKKEYQQARVVGVDFSPNMLKIAREKHPEIEFLEADCTQLPFNDEQFDLCVISFGLRNIENIEKALKEIYRVLKKGGYFINIDLGKPNRFFNIFLKPYMYLWVALLGKIFHGDETPYKYLAKSNEDFPSPKQLAELFKEVGFSQVTNKNYVFGQIASQNAQK